MSVQFSQITVGTEFRFPGSASHWVKINETDYRLAPWEKGTHPRSHDVHHVDDLFGMQVIPS